MLMDVERDLKKLKNRREEIVRKMRSTRNFDEKEKLGDELRKIEKEIKILEDIISS